ncbi:uncharacterized protein LOC126404350 [Epinephelus moara]|uniref:uncharacterized protein LOC126404350 n=1 Tax=Epinephelus moara TaxID=300413 RepID=UPI00214E36DB|nr:uncharacterized protein LOC126404350 [Epinephelus moara]
MHICSLRGSGGGMASAPRGGKTTRSNPRSNPNPREPNKVPTGKGAVDEENYEAEDKEKLGRAQRPGARTKDRTAHTKPGAGHSGGAEGTPPRWKKPKAVKHGAFLFNRYETSEEEEAVIKGMRGEEEDEAMHANIVAAIEAESDSVLANFGTEDLAKVVLITIKAAVPAIVKAVQKQLSASVDCYKLDKCKLESRYKEDELEQYSRKENVRINGIEETDEETEDQLVEKVCQLAAAAGATVTEKDISTAHRLGGAKKQGKIRPTIVRFVSRRKKAELMRNKSTLREKEEHRDIFISDDLTRLR